MKLFGKNPVIERLRANPQSIRKIYIQQDFNEAGYIRSKARQNGIPVFVVPASKLSKMGRAQNTQGILVDVDEFAYVPYEELLAAALKKKRCLIFLDGLNDPQNLGAILRSLACLGKFSAVLPTHDSVEVTEAVLRVACGGDNYVPVAKVNNLGQAIARAKESGFWIAGTVLKDGQSLLETSLPHPLGVVVGSEQKGIRDVIRRQLDLALTIPMSQETLSLNAAHAAAILAYEITKQKKTSTTPKYTDKRV